MLTYYLGGYNDYTIRTKQICSGSNYLRVTLQNMMTQDNYSFINGPGQWSYNECESIVSMSFNLSISSNSIVGDQYRVYLTPAISNSTTPFTYCEDVWHGSLAVFTSQSIDKPGYVNQIPEGETFISRDSVNEYIVWSQAAPAPSTTTTTTIAPTTTTTTLVPTTTTTSTTSTTTLAPTTTTTTVAPGAIDADFRFNRQAGGMGFNVCASGSILPGGTIDSVVINEYKLFMSSDSNCTVPYGTSWDLATPPFIYNFSGNVSPVCTSGGDLNGTYYRSRVSGSLQFQYQPGFQVSPLLSFDISGSGFQDLTFAGRTLRVYAAGCVLNDNTPGCP